MILAFDPARKNNSDLIADAASLGYLSGRVLDATYGKGNFWNRFTPEDLTTNDLRTPAALSWDWQTAPPKDLVQNFDATVYDPPYKLCGTIKEPDQMRWGLGFAPYQPVDVRIDMMLVGLKHCAETVRENGYLLLKTQDQVANHKVHWLSETLALPRLRKVDELYLTNTPRTQRSQKHARRNYSSLVIYQKTTAVLATSPQDPSIIGATG